MRHKRGIVWITTGLLLIAAALCLAGYNLYEANRAKSTADAAVTRLEELIAQQTEPDEDASARAGEDLYLSDLQEYAAEPVPEMSTKTVNGQEYIGMLEIPAYSLELPVISQWSYPGLKIAPCRYTGSAYSDDMILCAHNYPSHFGNIKNLVEGDRVIFTDVEGNVYTFEVALSEILEPTDVEGMESGDWDLTLFTCTVGGSYRVTVRCRRIPE